MRYWVKLYTEIVNDPKMGRLTDRQFRTCINLFALAGEIDRGGELPGLDDLAWRLRMQPADLTADLEALAAVGIMSLSSGVWTITKWEERQSQSISNSKESRRERVKQYRDRREELGLSRGVSYSPSEVFERDGMACVYCGSVSNLCVDHAYPIQRGGTDDDRNLVTACKRCNGGKAGRTPEEARYTFGDKDAERRYLSYVSDLHVTVTGLQAKKAVTPVTPPEKNRIDIEKKRKEREDAPAAQDDDFTAEIPPEIRAINNAYDACGLMMSKTHLDAHLLTIRQVGIPAWQQGWAKAMEAGKHNIPAYVARCAESAMLAAQRDNGHKADHAPQTAEERRRKYVPPGYENIVES